MVADGEAADVERVAADAAGAAGDNGDAEAHDVVVGEAVGGVGGEPGQVAQGLLSDLRKEGLLAWLPSFLCLEQVCCEWQGWVTRYEASSATL